MIIHLNPKAQAEQELDKFLKYIDVPVAPYPPGAKAALIKQAVMDIISRAVHSERLLMGEHDDCGADNPEGIAALCKCYCHKGHYRHAWQQVIKTPALNPDGTYHLLDRCKYCPDMRFKVFKAEFDAKGKHTVMALEYLVRGEQRVLTKEEWLERKPQAADIKLLREGAV